MSQLEIAKCQVLFERSDHFHASGAGYLSIKSFTQGEALRCRHGALPGER
ncbi:MAG: hypothetical protein R2867_15125 [Caldilineaceae bacterium]